MLSIPLHGRLVVEAIVGGLGLGLATSMALGSGWPFLVGLLVAVIGVTRASATRVEVDDERVLEVRGVRRGQWRARLADVQEVRVASSWLGRRSVEVVTADGVHRLAAPRDGVFVRDPHLDDLVADLRSRLAT